MEYPGRPDAESMHEWDSYFDYAVWTPNTKVTLTNVPWDSAYRNIVQFGTVENRAAWFAARSSFDWTIELTGMVYLRYGEPIRINVPFSVANNFNYIIVENKTQPVPSNVYGYYAPHPGPDVFFYFITDIAYIAPNTTQLNLQLDVWTTYFDRISFGLCYVNKGHIGIANENSTVYNTAEYLLEPEGLNYGDEYETVDIVWRSFVNNAYEGNPLKEPDSSSYWVLIQSTADLTADPYLDGTANVTTAKGMIVDNIPGGCDCYACDYEQFIVLMEYLSIYPWISQCISNITMIPRMILPAVDEGAKVKVGGADVYPMTAFTETEGFSNVVENWRTRFEYPERYANLAKFYTSPYSIIELTALNGGEVVLKPECLQSEDVTVEYDIDRGSAGIVHVEQEFSRNDLNFNFDMCFSLPNVRAYLYPVFYNGLKYIPVGLSSGSPTVLTGGENLDLAICYSNFPTLSLVNNMYIMYMASTQNSRNYQFASADWSQQKAMTAASTAYDVSQNAIDTSLANLESNIAMNRTMTGIQNDKAFVTGVEGAISGGVGALTGAIGRDPGQAISSATNAVMSAVNISFNQSWNNQALAAQITNQSAIANNQANQQRYAADKNMSYAQYAAKGDYEVAIQGIQAKCQDARVTQPSTSGQNGGDTFNASQQLYGFMVKFKRIKDCYVRSIGDFWLRYGYYVNRWLFPPDSAMVMEHFTYWKMQEAQINGDIPESFKETLRGIFEKGVTVWADAGMINAIDLADNEPLEGVRY